MVGGMVNLAAINDTGKNRERVKFAVLLKNSAESFRAALEQQGNKLQTEIASDMPDVYVEADKFMQVLANLFSNAAYYTHNGQITVLSNFDSTYITVRIIDTGEGIKPELLPAMFKRGTSSRGSTGYGLYICKTVVEAHGGTIDIKSEPGKGTTVTFTVPVYGGQEERHKQ
jgi:signal transduction histidine kinase